MSACIGEKAAAVVLGFTQVSWDNLSGKEQQPSSSSKSWAALTEAETAAAVLLGYSQTTWENDSGSEPRPASTSKSWSELTTCATGESSYSTSVGRMYWVSLLAVCFRAVTMTKLARHYSTVAVAIPYNVASSSWKLFAFTRSFTYFYALRTHLFARFL